MKIVILLSTYNGEKYIDKQLESIYEQDINAEIVLYIRDDGSSDKTVEKVNKWNDKIRILWADSSRNMGVANSFWYLLKSAPEGDYYAFCDQDDFWYKDKLSRAVNAIENYSKEQIETIYFSSSRMVDENLNPINIDTYLERPILKIGAQLVCGSCQGSAMVMNNKCRKNLLNETIKNMAMHDLTSILYTIVKGKIIYDKNPSLDYRQHENNVESNANKSKIARLKQSYNRWIKNKHVMSNQAMEIIGKYEGLLDEDDKKFCRHLASYRNSYASKIYLISNVASYCKSKSAIRSFKIRIFLNLF